MYLAERLLQKCFALVAVLGFAMLVLTRDVIFALTFLIGLRLHGCPWLYSQELLSGFFKYALE